MRFGAIIYAITSDVGASSLEVYLDKKGVTVIKVDNLSSLSLSAINVEYVFFIRDGDKLHQSTLSSMAKAIDTSAPDLIYSDEMMVCNGKTKLKFFKPDFSIDQILSMNYFGNLLCIKKSVLENILLPNCFNDQNFLYSLILRVVSKTQKIYHLDKVLYIRKSSKASVTYADFYENFDQQEGRKSIEEYCLNNKIQATVSDGKYHGTYWLMRKVLSAPLVSIIIPARDRPELLKTCIDSILSKTTYKNFEIIGVDNGSVEQETLNLMSAYEERDARIKFYRYDAPFNFCQLNNFGIAKAKGEHLLLLNNDIEVISENWIEGLLSHSQRSEIGIVGAKLFFSDGTIQHAGVHTAYMGHPFRGLSKDAPGYFYFPHVMRNFNAVTFACVMFKRSLYETLGELDTNIPIVFNDVEYCVRARLNGYLNVFVPNVCLYHFESKTRPTPKTRAAVAFENRERTYVVSKSPRYYVYDEYYNRNLTRLNGDYIEKLWIEGLLFYAPILSLMPFVKLLIPVFFLRKIKQIFSRKSSKTSQ